MARYSRPRSSDECTNLAASTRCAFARPVASRGHALHYAVRFRYSIVCPGLHAVAKMEIRT